MITSKRPCWNSRRRRQGNVRRWAVPVAALGAALLTFPTSLPAQAAPSGPPYGAASGPTDQAGGGKHHPDRIPATDRKNILGAASDTAITTTGDTNGFHVLVADADSGYRFKTVATLSEEGFDADTWIGNACVTASGKRAIVAYAPRTFTNKADLMSRGAFTAVVDLTTGKSTKLPVQASLAYFSPGCGAGEEAVLSQFTDDAMSENATRLITVNVATATAGKPLKLAGQVTSAIPDGQGAIVAADGARLVRIDSKGHRTVLADTHNVPFQIMRDTSGALTYLDRPGQEKTSAQNKGSVYHLARTEKAKPSLVATGKLAALDLARSANGEVFITGSAVLAAKAPAHVRAPGGLPKGALVSSKGHAALSTVWADGKDTRIRPEEYGTTRTVNTTLYVTGTGKTATVQTKPAAGGAGTPSPALVAPRSTVSTKKRVAAAGDPHDPVENERTCAVPRNDPDKQAYQPSPRQVEWAVNQAVVNNLNKWIDRGADWKGTNMAAYRPQTLFPLRVLDGDPNGKTDVDDHWHIPSQVLLGVTAQETNMWQATRYAVPGVTANSLIGNYYGIDYAPDGGQSDPWQIHWDDADCGYGITQVTDGMRMAGKEKPGETPKTKAQQEAAALDYTANIAAGADILAEKWNTTHGAGMTINDGRPEYIENWFFALWAYNSGFYPESQKDKNNGYWGLGFTNNPANPLWKANRGLFLEGPTGKDDYSQAAHPQDWPYPEKVIGWAARPIEAMTKPGEFGAGYRPAWWNDTVSRTRAKPPIDLFCDASNHCDPGKIGDNDSNAPGEGACQLDKDEDAPDYLHCWWNKKASWKDCVGKAQCGNPIERFNTTDYPEQPDVTDSYPPRCTPGLPAGSYVIDDLEDGARPAGSPERSCPNGIQSDGSFDFTFTDWKGTYPGKIDTHQIGAGYGGHFYFSHTRDKTTGHPTDADGKRMYITGKWTLDNAPLKGWARVMVHLPDHGAHTRKAAYEIGGTDSTGNIRVLPQRVGSNKWVDLGVFNFTGTPSVSLSTHEPGGDGAEDVAWDAVGFTPLKAKPKNFVVAMGDSYSSGEGVSESNGVDYYHETDVLGDDPKLRDACHRSKKAWSRQATLPGTSKPVGELADTRDPDMDYHLIACSGAVTADVSGTGQHFGEAPQIQQGYLDQNTTLVTISIGGNDARFTKVFQACVLGVTGACQDDTLDGDPGPLKDYEPKMIKEQVRPAITATLKEIRTKAPHAKIVLMGYPELLSKGGGCIPAIGQPEAAWINEMSDVMNTEMKGAAADAGMNIVFSDPTANFKDKGACGDPEDIHAIVLDKSPGDDPDLTDQPVGSSTLHPKIAGARLYADALEKTLSAG
ncbi:SGNH/GDSL hydrolase family protein [Streptomyces lunalinharesii]|uniref:SGNH hydrolase-type esterase domain-containing protein n=1 Tax=Streptomyces lunalinharesii TaxID=333384 RepID=A0ABP6DJQ8_9ACTN